MAISDIKRASQVVRVLAKHGFGWIIEDIGVSWRLPIGRRLLLRGKKPENLPVQLRKAFEELGGAYLKLGQLLSLRSDLVPQDYCDEFQKLLDKVPPVPFTQVKKVIEEELKKPINDVFASIDSKPVGSASVAQVHRATLKNKKEVVVKVQRPQVHKDFESDINILRYFAHKLEKKMPNIGCSPSLIVDEFERYTKDELNFTHEARNITELCNTCNGSRNKCAICGGKEGKCAICLGYIIVPEVEWGLTTKKIVVMEYLDGIKLSELKGKKLPVSRKTIVKRLADAMTVQVFEKGTFHADLHPGNAIVMSNGKIGLIDFGIVGHLTKKLRAQGLKLYASLVDRDVDKVVDTLFELGFATEKTNRRALERDVQQVITQFYGTTLREARPTQMLYQLTTTSAKHNLRLPVDIVLLGKGLVTFEGTAARIDPTFNFSQYSIERVKQIMKKTPRQLSEKVWEESKDVFKTLADLPEVAYGAMEQLKRGKITLDVQDSDIKHVAFDLMLGSNRLAYAIMIAAFVISASMLVEIGPIWHGYPVFSSIGILIAIILAFPLIVSIIKTGATGYNPHER